MRKNERPEYLEMREFLERQLRALHTHTWNDSEQRATVNYYETMIDKADRRLSSVELKAALAKETRSRLNSATERPKYDEMASS